MMENITELEYLFNNRKNQPSDEQTGDYEAHQKKFKNHGNKLPIELKMNLIDLVTNKNLSLKRAAKKLEMSYSTAKKIHCLYKRNLKTKTQSLKIKPQEGTITAEYRSCIGICFPVIHISTIGGKFQTPSKF